jgi:hypothetical protein
VPHHIEQVVGEEERGLEVAQPRADDVQPVVLCDGVIQDIAAWRGENRTKQKYQITRISACTSQAPNEASRPRKGATGAARTRCSSRGRRGAHASPMPAPRGQGRMSGAPAKPIKSNIKSNRVRKQITSHQNQFNPTQAHCPRSRVTPAAESAPRRRRMPRHRWAPRRASATPCTTPAAATCTKSSQCGCVRDKRCLAVVIVVVQLLK